MKHFRILLPLLILALVLSGCGSTAPETYDVAIDANRTVTIHPDSGTITYGSDVYRYNIKNGWGSTRYELTYPDGQRYTFTESKETGEGEWSENYGPSLYLPSHLLIRALKKPAPEAPNAPREKKGNPVSGILCIIVGVLLMVFHKHGANSDSPRKFVSFDSSGKYGVEVTKEERAASTFVAGIFCVIAGLCLCIF